MTRARSLSLLANSNIFTVDQSNSRVGIGSTIPDVKLDVDGDMNVTGTLTYEDVTNVETAGITTTGGLVVTGLGATIGGITTFFGDINFGAAGVGGTVTPLGHGGFTGIVTALGFQAAGVITATSFRGDGSELSGVDSSNLIDSGSTNRVAANTSGIVVTGIATVTGDVSIADKIIHTGDTNTAIRFPAADTVTVETGGSERLRVNSSGNIGINSTIPRSKLHVANGNSNFNTGNPTGLGAGAVASLESNTDVALQFLTSTTTDNFIYFGDTDSATTGSIQYDHNVNSLIFNVNGGTERLSIDSNGRVKIGNDANYSASSGAKLSVELMSTAGTILEVADQTDGFSTLESVKNAGGGASDYGGYILRGRRDADDDAKEYLRILADGSIATGSLSATPGTVAAGSFIQKNSNAGFFVDGNDGKFGTSSNHAVLFQVNGSEKLRVNTSGEIGIGGANYGTSGQVLTSKGSGSAVAWEDASGGISTQAGTASGIVTSMFLNDATDHKVTATGICTITTTQAGTEGQSHTIRIVNSGIATVGFSTYFLFPSGSAPSLPTADGAVSLISFTVHDSVGAGCTQLLAGASVNFS